MSQDHKHVLLIDFSNAFNSVSRQHLFQEVRSNIPSLSHWIECSYGSQPFLLLDDKIIKSCCGVQQGDPLGPLGFSLVLQPIIQKIRNQVPNLKVNAWYLDDGTLCGSPADLAQALDIIESEGPSCGLHLKISSLHPSEHICLSPQSARYTFYFRGFYSPWLANWSYCFLRLGCDGPYC